MRFVRENYNNSDKSNILYIIIGAVIGAFFSGFNIIVSIKTGLSVDGGNIVALLGFIILTTLGKYTRRGVGLINATAAGGLMCMFALDSAIVASMVFNNHKPTLLTIIIIGLVASTVGIIIAYYLHDYFIKELKLVFPLAVSSYKIIETLDTDSKGKYKYIIIGVIISSVLTISISFLHILPENIIASIFGIPSFIGFSLSPMLFAVGFFIDFKPSKSIILGTIFSILVWIFSEKALSSITYNEHSNNMWIISTGITVMIVGALLNICSVRMQFNQLILNCKTKAKVFKDKYAGKGTIMSILFVIIILGGIYALNDELKNNIIFLIILVPLALVSAILGCMTSGETGLAPITPLGILTFLIVGIFIKDFNVIMYLGALI